MGYGYVYIHSEDELCSSMLIGRVVRQDVEMSNPVGNHDVLVMATMSAGKSTLINALIGTELLPAMNEATTACHFELRHKSGRGPFHGSAITDEGTIYNSIPLLERKVISEWNRINGIKKVELSGAFKGRGVNRNGLVFHDTPGPNNSQDEAHSDVAFGVAGNIKFDTFLYVIDATQIGTNDDRHVLERILSDYSGAIKKPPIFVLNKADMLDSENGECISSCVKNVESYLVSTGFASPIIIPCSARLALCARKELSREVMTRQQRWILRNFFDHGVDKAGAFFESAIMPEETRGVLTKRFKRIEVDDVIDLVMMNRVALKMKKAVSESGIRIIEELISIQRKDEK